MRLAGTVFTCKSAASPEQMGHPKSLDEISRLYADHGPPFGSL
jgi:hypothetical protein